MSIVKVNIIGRGNVASHLLKAFQETSEVAPVLVNPHTFDGLDVSADVTIISVSDNAIGDIIEKLPPLNGIMAHTSGSTTIDIFKSRKESYGVFYPFQTFTKGKNLNYSDIPFFIEASDETAQSVLMNLASNVSKNVYKADSQKRKAMHVAGVYACNFTNHLWAIADKILKENGMDFNVLHPLLRETLNKTETMSPFDGQTGPAVRNDTKTINAHLDFLHNHNSVEKKDMVDIYNLLTASIIQSHSHSAKS